MTPGWNAPQGVENVHTLCAGKPESNDRGNNILICKARRTGKQFGTGGGGGGGKHSRGLTFQGQWRNEKKSSEGGGGQTKNLHHHQSYTLHAGPAERFSKWSIIDQVERKLAWGPGHEPRQGVKGLSPRKLRGFRYLITVRWASRGPSVRQLTCSKGGGESPQKLRGFNI